MGMLVTKRVILYTPHFETVPRDGLRSPFWYPDTSASSGMLESPFLKATFHGMFRPLENVTDKLREALLRVFALKKQRFFNP